jgi:hypothetical protein
LHDQVSDRVEKVLLTTGVSGGFRLLCGEVSALGLSEVKEPSRAFGGVLRVRIIVQRY